jgi:hypothetical protein
MSRYPRPRRIPEFVTAAEFADEARRALIFAHDRLLEAECNANASGHIPLTHDLEVLRKAVEVEQSAVSTVLLRAQQTEGLEGVSWGSIGSGTNPPQTN